MEPGIEEVTSATAASTGGSVTASSTGGAASTGASASSTGTVTTTGASTASASFTSTTGSTGGVAGTWPNDWRQQIAGQDEKVLKRLERYAGVRDLAQALIAAQDKIASGQLKTALPKDATPEQIKAWRAENGIPESHDKYELKLKNGLVVGEEDKPVVEGFLKAAHEKNLNTEQATAAVEWYYDEMERQAEARQAADQKATQEAADALRKEWGGDYRANFNGIYALLDLAPAGFKDAFLTGRLADGTPIGSSVEGMQWLASLARQLNPVGSLVPGVTGTNQASAIDDEIKAIETLMRTNRAEYNKDTAKQARLRDLYAARDQLKAKK